LRRDVLQAWFPRTLDHVSGGYLSNFDHRWRAGAEQPKTVVFQARALWLAARGWEREGADSTYRLAAEHGYAFLRDRQWDPEHGGYFWRLDRSGTDIATLGGVKHAYGQAFAVFGLAAYASVSGSSEALHRAWEAFLWLERHAYDRRHGGYFEFYTREGHRVVAADAGTGRDPLGTPLGLKSMNAHVHLLEAFTALYRLRPAALLQERLSELLELIRDRITVVPPGAMHQLFLPDWTPLPGACSYGHDIESAYLLLDAARALGEPDDRRTRQVAQALVDHSLEWGWDPVYGGLFDSGGAIGPVYDRRKVWWAQAECLNALALMAQCFPGESRFHDLFTRQWRYIREYLIDRRYGGWTDTGRDTPRWLAPKSHEWKCGYHSGRALMNGIDWLQEEAGDVAI